MYQLAHIVNTILYRAKKEGVPITQMKLQKMIYFLYAEHLYSEKEPLFAERFEAWQYGPVLSDVDYAFGDNGSKRINKYMRDHDGKMRVVDMDQDWEFSRCFNTVWARFSDKSGIELSKRTLKIGSAWRTAIANERRFLSDADIAAEAKKIAAEFDGHAPKWYRVVRNQANAGG